MKIKKRGREWPIFLKKTLLFKKPLKNKINVTKLNKNLIETEDLASVATVFNRIARQLTVLFLIKVIELRLILTAGVSYENAVVCENVEKILIRKKITSELRPKK